MKKNNHTIVIYIKQMSNLIWQPVVSIDGSQVVWIKTHA